MNATNLFKKPIQPQWGERKQSEEEYFAKQERLRNYWFDFFCINPFSSKPTNINATNNYTSDGKRRNNAS